MGDVLATVLAQMENLESVGDATELWNHVRLAVQAYRRSARGAEAKRVCLDAVATLAEFCSIAIAKEPPRAGTAGLCVTFGHLEKKSNNTNYNNPAFLSFLVLSNVRHCRFNDYSVTKY